MILANQPEQMPFQIFLQMLKQRIQYIPKLTKRMKLLAVSLALMGGAMAENWVQSVMDVHNDVRRQCGQADLSWDHELAEQAARHANKCVFEHSADEERPDSGENIAKGTRATPAQLAQLWANEKSLYTPGSEFTPNAGHYTQMAWKDTTKVGCSYVVNCPDHFGHFLVCQYKSAGNYEGQFSSQVCVPSEGGSVQPPQPPKSLRTEVSPSETTPGETSPQTYPQEQPQESVTTTANPDGTVTVETVKTYSNGAQSIERQTRTASAGEHHMVSQNVPADEYASPSPQAQPYQIRDVYVQSQLNDDGSVSKKSTTTYEDGYQVIEQWTEYPNGYAYNGG